MKSAWCSRRSLTNLSERATSLAAIASIVAFLSIGCGSTVTPSPAPPSLQPSASPTPVLMPATACVHEVPETTSRECFDELVLIGKAIAPFALTDGAGGSVDSWCGSTDNRRAWLLHLRYGHMDGSTDTFVVGIRQARGDTEFVNVYPSPAGCVPT